MGEQQCCRDTVAMWINGHTPKDGEVVECRWNRRCADGYGLFKDGSWSFHEGFTARQRAFHEASPEATAARNAFLADFRGRRLAAAMKDDK